MLPHVSRDHFATGVAELKRAYFAPPVQVPLARRTRTFALLAVYYTGRYVLDWTVFVVLFAFEGIAVVFAHTCDASVQVGAWLKRPSVAFVWVSALRVLLAWFLYASAYVALLLTLVHAYVLVAPVALSIRRISAQLVVFFMTK